MTRLSISGLAKRFDKVAVLKGFDLEIANGELISLLGPSGCGKTTTLRCIAGFEQPSSGRIEFDGADVVRLPAEKRDIGMVFQNYALFPHMTVAENLAFGLEMRKVAKPEIERRTAEVLKLVQLSDLGGRYPRQLSGGQQQRVALARALVIEPKLLLLDEPLANLDAKLREEMRFFIRSLQRRVGITTVYVTHDQAEAMVISDRIVVMFGGEIAQIGSAGDVYDRPASRQVASFIGLSNFIDGTVDGMDGEYCNVDTRLGRMRCRAGGAPAKGTAASILARPEVIVLSSTEPQDVNRARATVAERYFLGNMIDYRLDCGDGVVMQTQQPPHKVFEVGASVWFAIPAGQTWLLAR
ncbi:MAG: ABC transporter ATP-binding protein [Alphaproteobacteria bacterium]|nr:ABC transporter ATP-binding protein [Alphaproteobacteria bacterium]